MGEDSRQTDPRPLLSAQLRALAAEHADHVELAAAALPVPAGLTPRGLVHAARVATIGAPISALGPEDLTPREVFALVESIAFALLALRVQRARGNR